MMPQAELLEVVFGFDARVPGGYTVKPCLVDDDLLDRLEAVEVKFLWY